jgi:hypothetical protein
MYRHNDNVLELEANQAPIVRHDYNRLIPTHPLPAPTSTRPDGNKNQALGPVTSPRHVISVSHLPTQIENQPANKARDRKRERRPGLASHPFRHGIVDATASIGLQSRLQSRYRELVEERKGRRQEPGLASTPKKRWLARRVRVDVAVGGQPRRVATVRLVDGCRCRAACNPRVRGESRWHEEHGLGAVRGLSRLDGFWGSAPL